jgi:hypothetical protein
VKVALLKLGWGLQLRHCKGLATELGMSRYDVDHSPALLLRQLLTLLYLNLVSDATDLYAAEGWKPSPRMNSRLRKALLTS